jgi:hypothetical protein
MLTRRREGAKKLFAQRRDDATVALRRANGASSPTPASYPAKLIAADAAERYKLVASSRRRANQSFLLRAFAASCEKMQ